MEDKVALIDLDGTVADYDKAMSRAMMKIQHPSEEPYLSRLSDKMEEERPYVKERRWLIQRQPGFWRNLERLKLGFDIVDELRALQFSLHVLTKGPTSTPNAWGEKVEWCKEHIPDAIVTVAGDKSLVYGRVLVDDWPPYFLKWLEVRPRGLVVCVEHSWNKDVNHPNVFHYNGSNRADLRMRLLQAYERESGK